MAGSVNKVILLGNLGREPEIRHMQDGSKIAQLSIATSENWKDRTSGERKEKTEWHRVVVFNPNLAEIAEKYLRKGSKVYVEGQLQTRKWTDQAGAERYTTEIVLSRFKGELTLLDGRGEGMGGAMPEGGEPSYGAPKSSQSAPQATGGGGWDVPTDLDDEIPF